MREAEETGTASRTMARTAQLLCDIHQRARHKGERPYLSLRRMARELGQQSRDATRRDLSMLAYDSMMHRGPFVLVPYNRHTHRAYFEIVWGGKWMSNANPFIGRIKLKSETTFAEYQANQARKHNERMMEKVETSRQNYKALWGYAGPEKQEAGREEADQVIASHKRRAGGSSDADWQRMADQHGPELAARIMAQKERTEQQRTQREAEGAKKKRRGNLDWTLPPAWKYAAQTAKASKD